MNNTHLENQENNNVESTNISANINNENINVINISSIVDSASEKISTSSEAVNSDHENIVHISSTDSTTCTSAPTHVETAHVASTDSTTSTSTSTCSDATHSVVHSSSEVTESVKYNSTVTTKPGISELPKIVQKLEKLEKMINPNSKKSLILWEEDNSFKNLISSIVTYATTCDTTEFPIELLDRLKALAQDVDTQIAEGAAKVEELTKQAKENTELSEVLSSVYIAAMAGTPVEEYEEKIQHPEIAPYKEHLAVISTAVPESEEYVKAEKAIKSKITNLENSVHITIDLERTTSKGGALQYIKVEVAPAVERLQAVYDEQYKVNEVTEINGEEAVMALAVRKTFSEKVYDTFVRPFANLFKRKSKVK